jgi:uncharacterized membrane protein
MGAGLAVVPGGRLCLPGVLSGVLPCRLPDMPMLVVWQPESGSFASELAGFCCGVILVV